MFQAVRRKMYCSLLIGCFLLLYGASFCFAENVPENIIFLDPDNPSALLVDKHRQTLYLFEEQGGQIRQQRQYSCSTGEVAGRKVKSGDKKTPEGVYFITHEYVKRYLSPIYGSRALPLNYPNFIDKHEGRNGSAIWLHGTNKILKPMDSNGCVAIENDNIDTVAESVDLFRTPVILLDQIKFVPHKQRLIQKEKLDRFVNSWASALEGGTYQAYLNHYDPEYLPDISWWQTWKEILLSVSGAGEAIRCDIKPIGYYQHNNIYLVLLDLNLRSSGQHQPIGRRQLFIKESADGLRAMGDDYLLVSTSQEPGNQPPIIAAARTLQENLTGDVEIQKMIDRWLVAWSNKDITSYAKNYAAGFKSGRMNKNAWVRYKKNLNKKYAFIKVTASDLTIDRSGSSSSVSFTQHYESSGYKVTGKKRLILIRENGRWKIKRELWEKTLS